MLLFGHYTIPFFLLINIVFPEYLYYGELIDQLLVVVVDLLQIIRFTKISHPLAC